MQRVDKGKPVRDLQYTTIRTWFEPLLCLVDRIVS